MTTHAFIWRCDCTGRAGIGYSAEHAGSHGPGAAAGAGAKRTYGFGLGQGRSAGGSGHAQASIQGLGSGARALRKYARDANAHWEAIARER
eukprot:6202345-Pleurochrysis_carterae.AAC.1